MALLTKPNMLKRVTNYHVNVSPTEVIMSGLLRVSEDYLLAGGVQRAISTGDWLLIDCLLRTRALG